MLIGRTAGGAIPPSATMNINKCSSTPEVQYGAAHKLKKGWVRLFTCGGDVKATAFGHWTREDYEDYLKILARHFDDLNQPIETEDSILITAGKDNMPVFLIDKGVFGPMDDNKNEKI